jgi:hypothetical protein
MQLIQKFLEALVQMTMNAQQYNNTSKGKFEQFFYSHPKDYKVI